MKSFPAKERDNAAKITLGALLYLGADIGIGDALALGPRISYLLPLTPAVGDPALKVYVAQFGLGIRMGL